MKEGSKTGIFAAVAVVAMLLAYVTSSKTNSTLDSDALTLKGKVLFEKFTDPVSAAALKLVRYETSDESVKEFEVTKDGKSNSWTIPSHESYPADASQQMANAANLFVGLKALDVASQKREDQVLYGVVEPNKQKESEGGEGVGMLVQMRDEKGDMLADLIIGKETDDKKRFVRVPSEDVIYVCEIDTTPLSTEFKKWIEADLLKLSSNDIENVTIRDYQIVPTNQGLVLTRNYEADLTYSVASGQWNAQRIATFESEGQVRTLKEDEQLNGTKLSDLKNVLDSLQLVDVAKKPSGLAADLKGDKKTLSNEALSSLAKRGFFPNPSQKDGDVVDFVSKNGELSVTTKDGVQYLIRLGASADASISETGAEGQQPNVSINRYLLVTTRVDDSKFPVPSLEKVPESVEELKAIERLEQAANSTVPSVDPSTPAAVPTESNPVPELAEPNTKPESDSSSTNENGTVPANGDSPSVEPTSDSPKRSENVSGSDKKLVSFQTQEGAQDVQLQPDAPQEKKSESKELTEDEWKEKLEATRDRINKENQRKIEARDDKLKAARAKVSELNGRFADWYYVISDSDFNRLRIELKDLIQPKSSSGPTPNGLPSGIPGLGGGSAIPGLGPN